MLAREQKGHGYEGVEVIDSGPLQRHRYLVRNARQIFRVKAAEWHFTCTANPCQSHFGRPFTLVQVECSGLIRDVPAEPATWPTPAAPPSVMAVLMVGANNALPWQGPLPLLARAPPATLDLGGYNQQVAGLAVAPGPFRREPDHY